MRSVTFYTIIPAILILAMIHPTAAQEQRSIELTPSDIQTAIYSGDRVEVDFLEISDTPAWQSLIDLSAGEKSNAEISILLERNATQDAQHQAREIETAWNKGHFDEALAMFENLADLSDAAEMSICTEWREPLSSSAERWGGDVRIGTRDSVYCVDLEIDYATGNLFALLLLQDYGTQSRWTMNFSDDNGQTWSETYSWYATYHINDAAATVVADHCYVLFTRGTDQDQVLGYRFNLSTGVREDFPAGSSYITVFTTTSPEAVAEVDVASNYDWGVNFYRLYLVALSNQDKLRFYWDDETAESWSQVSTGVTDAERALAICMNVGYSNYWLFASYVDNTGNLKIDAANNTDWDNTFSSSVNTTSVFHTDIGAWKDTVHCVHEYEGTAVRYCRYWVTYNGGASYAWGQLDSDTLTRSECPSLCARRGGGVGVNYRFYSTPRELRFMWRDYGGWPWDISPHASSEHPPYYIPSAMQYLGGDTYGIVYATWLTPYPQAAYFTYGPGCCNTPGDANNDGTVNVGDAVFMINFVFKSGDPPPCPAEGDANADCSLNVGDAVTLINYVFKSGTPPECGCVIR